MRESIPGSILDAVAADREEILDFTRALVALPTQNPPGASYRVCVELIAGKLRDMGLDCRVFEAPDPAGKSEPGYCLLGFHGKGARTLYFHGHYDVVPAAGPTQFSPYVRDGKLFGRGSSDMKGGLAAMIYAVKALKTCGLDLNGKIGLTIVPDEETGGARGSRFLAEAGLLGKDGAGMLTPEPTGGTIWNANRGAISLRVTVRGKPAHVGLHYRGVNAFERMLVVAQALLALKAEVESRKTGFKIETEAGRSSVLLLGGLCQGGTNFNVVPAECSFTVDRRINPEEDLEEEKQRLLLLLDMLRREGTDLDRRDSFLCPLPRPVGNSLLRAPGHSGFRLRAGVVVRFPWPSRVCQGGRHLCLRSGLCPDRGAVAGIMNREVRPCCWNIKRSVRASTLLHGSRLRP